MPGAHRDSHARTPAPAGACWGAGRGCGPKGGGARGAGHGDAPTTSAHGGGRGSPRPHHLRGSRPSGSPGGRPIATGTHPAARVRPTGPLRRGRDSTPALRRAGRASAPRPHAGLPAASPAGGGGRAWPAQPRPPRARRPTAEPGGGVSPRRLSGSRLRAYEPAPVAISVGRPYPDRNLLRRSLEEAQILLPLVSGAGAWWYYEDASVLRILHACHDRAAACALTRPPCGRL